MNFRYLVVVVSLFLTLTGNAFASERMYLTKEGHFAALTEEDLDTVIRYQIQKDSVALAKMIMDGRVTILKGGQQVYKEQSKVFAGKVKIRLPGETVAIWTVQEAIQ